MTWQSVTGRALREVMKVKNVKRVDGLPEVAQSTQKRSPIIWAILGVVLVACFGLFFTSKSHKNTIKPVEETYSIPSSDTADTVRSQPDKSPQANNTVNTVAQPDPEITQDEIALLREKQNEFQQRLSAPLMLVNNNQQGSSDPSSPAKESAQSSDRNMQFMSQVSAAIPETSVASTIAPLDYVIAEGNMIHAILEPATNSDLPGFVRAIVSEPSYSENGSRVLIPRGSRLIGQYKSGMLQGQTRVFMVWTRLITPSGISIQLGSPGVDSLGVAGMGADEINRHFWERFGRASLLSIIGAGAANAGVSNTSAENSASSYRTAMANSFSQSADESLQQDSRIPPTLTTNQGKPIMVFVAKDIHFEGVVKSSISKMNVYG